MKKNLIRAVASTLSLSLIIVSMPMSMAGTTTVTSPNGGSSGGGVSRSVTPVAPTVTVTTPSVATVAPRASMAPAATKTIPTNAFRDVRTDRDYAWATEPIRQLASRGVINTAVNYKPSNSITRAELTKIALLTFGHTVDTSVKKSTLGVADGHWAVSYMEAAKKAGILTKGNPDVPVNRAEALKILAVAAGVDLSTLTVGSNPFPDVNKSAWFASLVQWAKSNNVVGGYKNGTFGPGDTIDRAAAAKIAANLIK